MTTPLRSSGDRYLARRAGHMLAELPAPVLERYAPEQIRFAARAWTMKGEQEHRSANVFAEATSLLVDVGAPLDVVSAIARVVTDEVAHTELCVRMARTFETDAPVLTPVARTPVAPAGRLSRALRILLVEGAIGETISCALFNAGRHVTREPCTRAALARILSDEVAHARVCWEALAVMLADVDDTVRAALQSVVSRALGAIERDQMTPVLQRLDRNEPFDPAWGELGVLPPERRVEAFYVAVERRVIPSLTKLGMDGARAWEQRYARDAQP